MLTFYLELHHEQGSASVVTITGYGDEGVISRETFFSLYSARMRLTEIEDEGNVCIDTTMVGY